jgi:hypothetical protein
MSNLITRVWSGVRCHVRNVVITNRGLSKTLPRSGKPSVTVSSEAVPKQNTTSSVGKYDSETVPVMVDNNSTNTIIVGTSKLQTPF